MNPNNLVCRTCLGIISEGKVAHNIDDENGLIRNVRNIREMILFCVPEMDIYMSVSPVICESCLGILVSIYNFKIRCLRVENAIRSYITTNNVMEGSCVNLNNVVRQQIVEALKQKNWPTDLINEYVDKHLCTVRSPVNRLSTDMFQVMAQKFNAPRMLNSSSPRPSVFEPVPLANAVDNNVVGTNNIDLPPAYETAHVLIRPPPVPAPQGKSYICVSQNLMPQRPETPQLTQRVRALCQVTSPPFSRVNLQASAPMASMGPRSATPSLTKIGEFQDAFLNALQLTSTANGGREEAVLVKQKEKRKNTPKKLKKAVKVTVVHNHLKSRVRSNPNAKGESSVADPQVLCSITGVLRGNVNQEVVKETGLRSVRKSGTSQRGNDNNDTGENDDVIVVDDDAEMARVGDEMLLMNFEDDLGTSDPVKPPDFTKKIVVKLPMIDRETLKRKLTPEDVIDEIQSKRRKMVVELSARLPYLHKTKRLVVKIERAKSICCTFCRFATIEQKRLEEHHKRRHKMCGVCHFKCDRGPQLTHHINAEHPLELQEAKKKSEENRSNFHCYLCKFTGLSEFDLRDHRLRIHIKCNNTGMYKCPFSTCTKEHAIAYDLNRHIEKVHDKLRQTQCTLCNYVAQTPYVLKKHLDTHSLAGVKCDQCTYWCKTSFTMNMHKKMKHPNTKDRNVTGMVHATDLDKVSYSDDYRITLENLQSGAEVPRQDTAVPEPRGDQRSLDQYEFALPSLGEMLCSQTFAEAPSDHEGDCTIVSEDATRKLRRRGRSAKRPSVIINKKNQKAPESNAAEDPEDCMIISQEIPTVDLSDDDDDDDVAPSVAEARPEDQAALKDVRTSSDVIEIEDNDCFVVSDVPGDAENSTEKAGDSTAATRQDDGETDTCSELPAGAKLPVSGSETDTCSEISAVEKEKENISEKPVDEPRAVVSQSGQTDTLDGERKEDTVAEDAETRENVEPDSSTEQSARKKDIPDKETPASVADAAALNEEESAKTATDEIIISSSSKRQSCSSDQSDSSEDPIGPPANSELNLKDKSEPEKGENAKLPASNTSSGAKDSEKRHLDELLNEWLSDSSKSSEPEDLIAPTVPATTCSESFLIESSDEDSDECTFVSETGAIETVQANSEAIEKDVSEALQDSGDKKSKESQQELGGELDGKEESDAAKINRASDAENPDKTRINDCTDPIPTDHVPDSDVNVATFDSKSKSSEHVQTNVELIIEKVNESLVTDSELLNDSEMDSEASKREPNIMETEKNVSDILNTDSEMENIGSSEVDPIPTDNVPDSDVNVATFDSKSKSSEHVQTNVELVIEKVNESLVTDSELLNDSEMDSEASKREPNIMETEKNVSDILNTDSEMENIGSSEVDPIPTDNVPDSDVNVATFDSKSKSSEHVQTNVELVIEKVNESLVTDSELLNDSEMDSEASKREPNIMETEKNVSDILNTDSEMENIGSSEVDPIPTDNVPDSDVNVVISDSKSKRSEPVQTNVDVESVRAEAKESLVTGSELLNAESEMDSENTEVSKSEPNVMETEKCVSDILNTDSSEPEMEDIGHSENITDMETDVLEHAIVELENELSTEGAQNITTAEEEDKTLGTIAVDSELENNGSGEPGSEVDSANTEQPDLDVLENAQKNKSSNVDGPENAAIASDDSDSAQNILDREKGGEGIEVNEDSPERVVSSSENPSDDCQGENISESSDAISKPGVSETFVEVDLSPKKAKD